MVRAERIWTATKSKLVMTSVSLAFSTFSFADHPTLGLQQDGAGAITTLTAMTLPDGASVVGFEVQHVLNNKIDDIDLEYFAENGEQVHSVAGMSNLSLNVAYGLTDNLTIGANLPHVTRLDIREGVHHHEEEATQSEHDEHTEVDHLSTDSEFAAEVPEVQYLGDASGIGDLTLYSQYRFLGDSDSDSLTHASVMLGIKTPTGKTDLINNGGHRFEAEHQPGSGSWDLLAGLAFTRQWSQVSLDSNVLYAAAGDGSQDSNLGDVFNYNVALSYRLGPTDSHDHRAAKHEHADSPNSWDIAVELNGEWRDYVSVAGQRQAHTGGNLVYLAPSVRFNSSNGWVTYASLGVPVKRDLNGIQSDPKLRLFIGVSTALGQ